MHTPVEVLELEDLDQTADLLGAVAARANEHSFDVGL
jgi:putative aminopeptidase FrvX